MRSGEFRLVIKFPVELKGLRRNQVESVATAMQEAAKAMVCSGNTRGAFQQATAGKSG